METDYKFWYIKKDNDIHISECAIRFFEGGVTTENEIDEFNKVVPVKRYRRSKRLKKKDLPHLSKKQTINEMTGEECIVYTADDFGTITSVSDLDLFIQNELKKDKRRRPAKIKIKK